MPFLPPSFKAKDRLTKEDFDKLDEILDEERDPKADLIRKLAETKYDFSGFDHINMYDLENYKNGVLRALEKTRRILSIDSMHSVIDYYYILGYSHKRILFQLYEYGFENFWRRQVQSYIHKHRHRLKTARAELMNELEMAAKGVFQQMQSQVMEAEKRSLKILLKKINQLQDELERTDPNTESRKFNRINKTIEDLERRMKEMNGIDAMRDVMKEAVKAEQIGDINRTLSQGLKDNRLKQLQEKKELDNPLPAALGGPREVGNNVVMID